MVVSSQKRFSDDRQVKGQRDLSGVVVSGVVVSGGAKMLKVGVQAKRSCPHAILFLLFK